MATDIKMLDPRQTRNLRDVQNTKSEFPEFRNKNSTQIQLCQCSEVQGELRWTKPRQYLTPPRTLYTEHALCYCMAARALLLGVAVGYVSVALANALLCRRCLAQMHCTSSRAI